MDEDSLDMTQKSKDWKAAVMISYYATMIMNLKVPI